MAKKQTSKKKTSQKTVTKKALRKKTSSKSKANKAKKSSSKVQPLTKKKKPTKKYTHHPDHYNTSESYLTDNLEEDLKDAWFKIRELGASLGEQRIYASGRAIMFSKKVCYFFVRPKKSYLEVVIFLKDQKSKDVFKSIQAVSKIKFAHTFRLVHADQVEGELVDAISEAYNQVEA